MIACPHLKNHNFVPNRESLLARDDLGGSGHWISRLLCKPQGIYERTTLEIRKVTEFSKRL